MREARVKNPNIKSNEQKNSEKIAKIKLGNVPIPSGSGKLISPEENSRFNLGTLWAINIKAPVVARRNNKAKLFIIIKPFLFYFQLSLFKKLLIASFTSSGFSIGVICPAFFISTNSALGIL